MNSVSWFVYLADVIPNTSLTLIILACLSFLGLIISTIIASVKVSDGNSYPNLYPRAKEEGTSLFKSISKLIYIPILAVLIACFVPSRQTMYMIAASQIGEQIVQLEGVQELGGEVGGLAKDTIELLRQRINEELTPKPSE